MTNATVAWTQSQASDQYKIARHWQSSPDRHLPPEEEAIAGYLGTKLRQKNLALCVAASGFVLVDLDGEKAKAHFKTFNAPATFTVKTGRGWHCWFIEPPRCDLPKIEFADDATSIRFSADGYGIVAGWHAVEETWYRTVPGLEEIVELPEAVYWAIRKASGAARQRAREHVESGRKIPRGSRDSTITSYAGHMHSVGFPLTSTLAACLDLAENHCEPPLTRPELDKIRASVERWYRQWDEREDLDPFLVPDIQLPQPADVHKRPVFNDEGFATYFAKRQGHNYRFVLQPQVGKGGKRSDGFWIGWNGHFWVPGSEIQVEQACLKEMKDAYWLWAHKIPDEGASDADTAYKKRAKKFLSRENYRAFMTNTILNARGRMLVPYDGLDADPWLLATANGVLELKTGTLREPRRDDWLTHGLSVTYNPGAGCPRWIEFIDQVTCRDQQFAGYLQRVLGYCLTGDVNAQKLWCFIGSGGNGKGTLINVISAIFGTYAKEMSFASLMQPTHVRGGSEATPDLAGLIGKRLVYCDENESGQRLRQSRITLMTGKSAFPVRDVYSKEVTLVPNFKLILIVNFKPELNVSSPAIRRRVVMVPFNADFSAELGNVVEGMDEILLQEADGIFSDWLVPGLMAYNKDGLGTCNAVREATQDYLKGANICADFVAECCLEERGALYPALQLREDINAWWDERNEPHRAKDDISLAMNALGFQTDRRTVNGIKTTYYLGLRPKGLQI